MWTTSSPPADPDPAHSPGWLTPDEPLFRVGQDHPGRVATPEGWVPSGVVDPPVRWIFEFAVPRWGATKPCEVGGPAFDAGDRLFLSWSSANYDEQVFEQPDEVVLDRYPNKHQSFGLGIHRCLGSNFARLEFQVVVDEVLRRMPDYEIDTAAAEPYPSIGVVNGWISLPFTFTPGTRAGSDFAL